MIVAYKNSGEVVLIVYVFAGSCPDVGGGLRMDEFVLGFAASESDEVDIGHHLSTTKEYGGYMVIVQSRILLGIANRSVRVVVVEVEQMDGHGNLLGRKWVKHMDLIRGAHSPEMDAWGQTPVVNYCTLENFVEAPLLAPAYLVLLV